MKRGVLLCLSLLCTSGALAWAQMEVRDPPQRPRSSAPALERQGEAFTFSLNVGPIEGARARVAIAPVTRAEGRRVVHVLGEVETLGLAKVLTQQHEDYRLLFDADTFLPRHMELAEKGFRTRKMIGEFRGRAADVKVSLPEQERRGTGELPLEPRDPVTAYLALRAARLHTGDRLHLVLIDGSAFYRGQVVVAARERIETQGGARDTIRLDCVGERMDINGNKLNRPLRRGTIWLSDDEARLPLRVLGDTDLGQARFDLTSHSAPRRRLVVPDPMPGLRLNPPA